MLKPKKKITKQEIERDPVLEKTIEVEQFIRHHAKNISIAIGVVAVVIIAAIFISRASRQKTLEASGKLGIAQMSIQKGDVEDGILRLEELIEDFGGTESASAAYMLLGQTYLEKGELEDAEKYYSEYLNNSKDDMAKAAAYKALGVCAENNGDWETSVANYKKAVKTAEYKFQKKVAQLSLVNASIEAKDFATAKKVLTELQDDENDYNTKNQIDMLSAKLAVLAK